MSKTATRHRSRLLRGAYPTPETAAALREAMGVAPDAEILPMVFEVALNDKTVYACWSGGEIVGDDVQMTLAGRGAFEALLSLPYGRKTLILQQLKLGRTPLRDKVHAAIEAAPEGAKICFFGDLAGELDGHMHRAFNVGRGFIDLPERNRAA